MFLLRGLTQLNTYLSNTKGFKLVCFITGTCLPCEDLIRELEKFYFELKALLNRDFENILILRGRVFSGLGEGRYYVSLEPYRKQFIEKLGFDPYPGTLNIKLEPECIKYRKILDNIEGIIIEPFKNGKRTYGGGRAFKALIQGKILGAIIIPERTHYGPDVVEIISPVCLRKTLKLRDGDMVILEVRVK